MKILSYYTDSYSDLGEINAVRWKKYCEDNNFEFNCNVLDEQKYPYWKKMELWIDELENTSHDYIVWTDIDVVLINKSISIYSIIKDVPITISSDHQGLCSGFIIIKNCEWSKNFFRSCYFLRDVLYEKEKIYSPSRKLEHQSCIKYLYDGFETVNSNIKLIDQDIVSHPRIGISDENFAHHFWMSSNPNRLELINYIKNLP